MVANSVLRLTLYRVQTSVNPDHGDIRQGHMTIEKINPIRDTDDDARAVAHRLIVQARTAALAVIDARTGGPHVTRIAFGHLTDGTCLALLSDLALHTRSLLADPRASLLIGEPGRKGDPLTQPRLTLGVTAHPVTDDAERACLREFWLGLHPKSKLYVDFADFRFFRFEIVSGHLNGGFGKAYALDEKDLTIGQGNENRVNAFAV
jgi:putative heme iron utilization protein